MYQALIDAKAEGVIDQALFAVIIEAYFHGVSTRKLDDLVKALAVDQNDGQVRTPELMSA